MFKLPSIASPIPPENVFDRKNLQAKRAYLCANHPHKEAFCMCAKCGAMLCDDCNIVVGSRRYCEACLVADDNLRMTLEREIFKEVQKQRKTVVVDYDGPQKWSEVPTALVTMLKDSAIFFKGAYKTPFSISFPIALLALLPNALIMLLYKHDVIVSRLSQASSGANGANAQQLADAFNAATPATLCLSAVLATVFQILILDGCLFCSVRLFTRARLKWPQICALLHFSLIPFGLIAFASLFDVEIIRYIALGLMIINTSTAVRSATNCSFWQGMGAMLSFIFFATVTQAINMYA